MPCSYKSTAPSFNASALPLAASTAKEPRSVRSFCTSYALSIMGLTLSDIALLLINEFLLISINEIKFRKVCADKGGAEYFPYAGPSIHLLRGGTAAAWFQRPIFNVKPVICIQYDKSCCVILPRSFLD